MHSGGATGADNAWGVIGEKFGLDTNNIHHYYYGNRTPHGNHPITLEEYNEGVKAVAKANETLQRNNYSSYMNLLARNWMQVKNADAVYAIAQNIRDNDKVDGGTGWAAQMAIDSRKPLFVYSQKEKKWYKWMQGTFKAISYIPKLTKNFAGIGTRSLSDAGRIAIREVYQETVNQLL